MLNDLNSIKLLLNVWVLVVIFWAYCFKKQTRCKLYKRNIVTSAFRNYWLKRLFILSACYVFKFVLLSAIWWCNFLNLREFSSKLSIRNVWTLINSSWLFILFKIWSDEFVIVNYVLNSFLRKIKAIKIVRL